MNGICHPNTQKDSDYAKTHREKYRIPIWPLGETTDTPKVHKSNKTNHTEFSKFAKLFPAFLKSCDTILLPPADGAGSSDNLPDTAKWERYWWVCGGFLLINAVAFPIGEIIPRILGTIDPGEKNAQYTSQQEIQEPSRPEEILSPMRLGEETDVADFGKFQHWPIAFSGFGLR